MGREKIILSIFVLLLFLFLNSSAQAHPGSSPTDKTAVLGETTTKPTSPLDTLIGLGILGGIGYGIYKIIIKNVHKFKL